MKHKRTLADHEAEHSSWFVCVTHKLSLADDMKITIRDFPKWAWIYHEPDSDDGTPHVHFMFSTNGTRTVKQIANKLGIESNYVQVCNSLVGYRRYMLHLDNKEKIQYTIDDVHTNHHSDFRLAINGNTQCSIFELYNSLRDLRRGKIKPVDFLEKHILEMEKLPFSQKIRVLESIHSQYGVDIYEKRAPT